jgi:hypothetical protein
MNPQTPTDSNAKTANPSGEASHLVTGSAKLVTVTEMRRALSGLLAEQALGIRDDINEQAEKLLMALYEAGAARAGALLEKYAPRHHGLSHERKCPACGGWWPRHAETCAIAEVILPTVTGAL